MYFILSFLLIIIWICSSTSSTVSNFFTWKNNMRIHYTYTTTTPSMEVDELLKDSVVLLPGFGVGTFHFSRNIQSLAAENFNVYCIDLLGQGKSWPESYNQSSSSFRYSLDTWAEEIIYFIESILKRGRRVHIAGNSLGGYLSVMVAYLRPDLVKSICLLNATPIWAFNSPSPSDEGVLRLWDGELSSAPQWCLSLGAAYFNLLRSPTTVKTMLQGVYRTRESLTDELIDEIITAASHPAGPDAFSSIVFSPKSNKSFDEMLQGIDGSIPICQIMGKDDPWITPLWGQRVKRMRPQSVYLELSPAGHCPHHEAPHVVNRLLPAWWRAVSQSSTTASSSPLASSSSSSWNHLETRLRGMEGVYEGDTDSSAPSGSNNRFIPRVEVEVKVVDGSARNWVERIAAFVHLNQLAAAAAVA